MTDRERDPYSDPTEIAAGPDGAMWFTEYNNNKVGRVTMDGVITEYPLTAHSYPEGITAGPDGNLWFTEVNGKIGRMTVHGVVTEYRTPTPNASSTAMEVGPDGRVWFTESFAVGAIRPSATSPRAKPSG
jgi:virginiamycin B lyase